MDMVANAKYITSDGIEFSVEIFHEKYKRCNYYKLCKSGEICAQGACPKKCTPRDIFNYWVRDEG